jgi:hypothetical protein
MRRPTASGGRGWKGGKLFFLPFVSSVGFGETTSHLRSMKSEIARPFKQHFSDVSDCAMGPHLTVLSWYGAFGDDGNEEPFSSLNDGPRAGSSSPYVDVPQCNA